MQALRRRSQSLPVKPLDSEHRFIDDFIGVQFETLQQNYFSAHRCSHNSGLSDSSQCEDLKLAAVAWSIRRWNLVREKPARSVEPEAKH